MEILDHTTLTFQLAHRSDLDLGIARWHQAVSDGELRANYEAVLQLAAGKKCGRWLFDLRRRPLLVDADTARWVAEDYFPRLRQVVGRLPALAFLVSPARASASLLQAPSKTASYDARVYITQTEAEAMAWLLH